MGTAPDGVRTTGRDLRSALASAPRLDDAFEDDVNAATASLTADDGSPDAD